MAGNFVNGRGFSLDIKKNIFSEVGDHPVSVCLYLDDNKSTNLPSHLSYFIDLYNKVLEIPLRLQ